MRRSKQFAVYIRGADKELWRRAEDYARRRRMPVSGLVMTAIEAHARTAQPCLDQPTVSGWLAGVTGAGNSPAAPR
jgi:hypothetical protein